MREKNYIKLRIETQKPTEGDGHSIKRIFVTANKKVAVSLPTHRNVSFESACCPDEIRLQISLNFDGGIGVAILKQYLAASPRLRDSITNFGE